MSVIPFDPSPAQPRNRGGLRVAPRRQSAEAPTRVVAEKIPGDRALRRDLGLAPAEESLERKLVRWQLGG